MNGDGIKAMGPFFDYRSMIFGLSVLAIQSLVIIVPSYGEEIQGLNALRLAQRWVPVNTVLPTKIDNNELSTFTPKRMPSETQRKLRQLEALITDKAWNDAFLLIDDLLIDDQDIVFTANSSRYAHSIPLKRHLQHQLAQLPSDGIRQYRNFYDSIASELYLQGIDTHDPAVLQEVIDDYFATSWADDAMLALGDLAFSSGDFISARGHWQMISPLTTGPSGEPIDVALSNFKNDIDLAKLEKIWSSSQRPFHEVFCRDTNIDISDILARLTLCSLQENDLRRAQSELLLLRALAPNQESWIAGRDQVLAAKLDSMLNNHTSPSNQGDRLGPLIEWQWNKLIRIPQPQNLTNVNRGIINRQLFLNQNKPPTYASKPKSVPVITDSLVLIQSNKQLSAWSISDGTKLADQQLGQPPVLTPQNQANKQNQLRTQFQAQLRINGQIVQGFNNPANINALRRSNASRIDLPWPGTLTTNGGKIIYATSEILKNRNGLTVTTNRPPTRILGFDPDEEGKRFLELDLKKDFPSTSQHFAGPPVVDGNRLYAVLNSREARNNLSVVCYSAEKNSLLWKTDIGSGVTDPYVTNAAPLKVLVEKQNLYLSTNNGAVVALNSATGKLKWISQYPSSKNAQINEALLDSCKCVHFNDRLYVAPDDSEKLICIDSNSGRLIWITSKTDPAAKIAAVTSETVLLSGNHLEAFDRVTASQKYLFPQSQHSGIRGMGIGVAAGDEYFWPTRNEIRVISVDNGSMSRAPINVSQFGSEGVNLARSAGKLVVVGINGMNVLGDQNPRNLEPKPSLQHLSYRGTNNPEPITISANQ